MLSKFLISIYTLLLFQNFLYSNDALNKVDLENIKITNSTKIRTKDDYEKEDDLLNPLIPTYENSKLKKEDDLELDGSVGINKEKKSIDEVKVNIGTKF